MAPSSTSNVLLTAPNEPAVPAEEAAVSLSRVTRVFGVTPALVRVDLEVARGEVLLVRGPNGAGKSTLLAILATVLSPTYGSGSVLGFPLDRGRDEIRRRIELIGHTTRLYEDLSGRENLRFWARLTGLDPGRVDGALESVGLAAAADERVRGYSQGMRQRVAVARATLREPALLLLDEPYAGLDDEAKEAVDALVARTAARGATVVLATHDPTRGGSAGRTLYMDGGRIVPDPTAGGPRP
ncbi:MAG TPA: heme ABC exporter ATP-binding protein CcmA [Actinomycetota bacterium]|nr:heme ABC exporter ATP-binding protein CcmA [Actinomycetota bacterium]